jgi:hypothetical protein
MDSEVRLWHPNMGEADEVDHLDVKLVSRDQAAGGPGQAQRYGADGEQT